MRVVVVEPPPEGAPRLGRSPLPVGAFDWLEPDPIVTVVVKVTYSFAGDRLALAPAQRALTGAGDPDLDDDPARDLRDPWDYAPYKPEADVLVVGHAFADGRPSKEIVARFSVGSLQREVLAVAEEPADRIPLHGGGLFSRGRERPERVGPARVPDELRDRRFFEEGFDYTGFHVAPPEQRIPQLSPGDKIRLAGLSPRGPLELELPLEAPRVLISWRSTAATEELQMFADTLCIDTDEELLVLTYRGMITAPRPRAVTRLVVALEPAHGEGDLAAAKEPPPRTWPEILRSAARGAFSISAGPEEAGGPPQDDVEDDRISAARAELMLGELPPEPTMTLDAFARISAELSEQREPRADVLKKHELDELSWTLEERAWLETISARAARGDAALSIEFGDRLVAAQDALARPHEADRTYIDWAAITVAVEDAEDLRAALAARGIPLAEWMRLDRRVQRAARADEALADELDRLVAEARARAAAGEDKRAERGTMPAASAQGNEQAGGER